MSILDRFATLLRSKPARNLLWVAFAISLAAGLFFFVRLEAIDKKLRAPCPYLLNSCAPHGILDWELAFDADRARAILARWASSDSETEVPGDLLESLELDRGFIWSYAILLSSLVLLVGKCIDKKGQPYWVLLALLPVVAALLDRWVENPTLAAQLAEFGNDAAITHTVRAGVAASLKFLLLATTQLALIIVAIAAICAWVIRPRLRPKLRFSQVRKKEEEYVRQRRQKADLPPEYSDQAPVGLALSGGGIRSATVNLGILQALAKLGILRRIDYLSTVSGGGYIGSALSSLLSINKKKIEVSPKDQADQYSYDPGDEPYFSTDADSSPFTGEADRGDSRGAFDSKVQLRHLRSCGAFLVRRARLFTFEFLRTVGSVSFGFIYHFVHFGLLFVAAAAVYMLIIYQMVGIWAVKTPGADLQGSAYGEYVALAFGQLYEGQGPHPFLIAAALGAVVTLLTLILVRRILPNLRRGLFWRRGVTVLESRRIVSVVTLPVVMLLTGLAITSWYVSINRHGLLNISLPLASYVGGGVVLFVRHLTVWRGDYDRSRHAAREGAFLYLILASLLFILVVLPFLMFAKPVTEKLAEAPIRSALAWTLSILGARFLAGGGGSGGGGKGAKGAIARLAATVPAFRRLFAGVAFGIAVLGGLLAVCLAIWNGEAAILDLLPQGGSGPLWLQGAGSLEPSITVANVWTQDARWLIRASVLVVALGLYCLMGLVNFNRLSLHYFYRDRLVETYLRTLKQGPVRLRRKRDNGSLPLTHLHGSAAPSQPPGAPVCVTAAPYHLLVTCLNLSTDRDRRSQKRKSDQFIFSKFFCGSETTGFLETREYREGETKLARAMTISGAAASPAMGRGTYFAQSAVMTLFNVRLGQWMENPGFRHGKLTKRRERWVFWPLYLLREALASTDANGRLVYLSDGGHTGDNLGILPLLKRRCRLIVVGDAEHDPKHEFGSLNEAIRQGVVDEGVEIDIRLDSLRPNSNGHTKFHHAIGRIEYPDAPAGWLIVLKSSLNGDEPEPLVAYRKGDPDFPHQSTGDLFFDEAQFEAYRGLGEHIAGSCFDRELLNLVLDDSEGEDRWQGRFAALKEELEKAAPA